MSKLFSAILVTVQFICIGYFLFEGKLLHVSIISKIILFLSLLIVIMAVVTMQLNNISVFPEPKAGVRLRTTGIYGIIRHPMYTSVLIFCLGLLINNFSKIGMAVLILLITVLLAKIYKEEKYLLQIFPEYAGYKKSSKRLIPFIW